jgi:hypothetical protein
MTTNDRSQQSGQHWTAATNHPNPGTIGAARAVSALGGAFRAARFVPLAGAGTRPHWLTTSRLEESLPNERDTMPILAHRVARLDIESKTRPFGSINFPCWFGIDARAGCGQIAALENKSAFYGQTDVPLDKAKCSADMPTLTCSCGFYAMPIDRAPHFSAEDFVTLLVELSGKVIACDNMYRARHQRVIECQLPPCRFCLRPAETAEFYGDKFAGTCCSSHHRNAERYCKQCDRLFLQASCPHRSMFHHVTIEELQAVLPVPVTSASPRGISPT